MAEIKVKGESRISLVPIYKISENISVPMRTYTKQQIIPLAESISHNGILQPLIVRRSSDYTFELISGKRRLQAAVMAGKRSVPCIVLHCTKSQSLLYSLTENFHRYDYTYLEALHVINLLTKRYNYSLEKLAELFGKRENEIESILKLNVYSSRERVKLEKYQISFDLALLLTEVKDEYTRSKYLEKIITENLTFNDVQNILSTKKIIKDNKKIIIKDMQIFHNSINKILETMKLSGIHSLESITEDNDYICYVIKIPK